MNWKQKLTSRKFWLAVVSAFLLVANEGLGLNLPSNVILPFVELVIAYILGETAIDVARVLKSNS